MALTKETSVSIGLVALLLGGVLIVYDRLNTKFNDQKVELKEQIKELEEDIKDKVQKEIYLRDIQVQKERNEQFERIIDLKLELILGEVKKLQEKGQ